MSKSREEGARSHLREIFSGALELTGGFDRRGNITEWFRAQKGESDQPRIEFQSYHCSLDFSEPYFLICKMGTISEPTLRVEVRRSIV